MTDAMAIAASTVGKRVAFANSILQGIDWEDMCKQKETLIGVRKTLTRRRKQLDEISAIIHLIDHLQDQAALVLGKEAVFGDSD